MRRQSAQIAAFSNTHYTYTEKYKPTYYVDALYPGNIEILA